jgi:2-polyprenyl-6-methoxyphenol hydroxylase-like FAD-dependent oxidoreductase
MSDKIDALIVGAGPVGLTMAAALTHHGLTYRIIEKSAQPTDKSKALVLWSRTLELFDPLGLSRIFQKNGRRVDGGSIYANNKRVVHFGLSGDESPFGYPVMIPQSQTERILSEHLASEGLSVERQVELIAFSEGADSVTCQIRHADGREEAVVTPWLIGCDGAHSTVRHHSGMPFAGHAEPNDWMLADVHIDGPLLQNEVTVFWHMFGLLIFFPIDQNRFRMIADLGASDPSIDRSDPTLADVQKKLDERGPGDLTATEPVWLANFRINERKCAQYRSGRVMLMGDAAHVHSPAGGQGMNTGMQDAFNLAWKLALIQQGRGQAEPLLQSFSIERSAIGDQVLKTAETFTTVATLRNPVAQSLRNHVAPILTSFQFFQDKVRKEWQELSINYRFSPLSQQSWPLLKGGQQAGDRLNYAHVTTAADGASVSLFGALDGTKHALLLLPGKAPDSTAHLLQIAEDTSKSFPGVISPYLILEDDPTQSFPAFGNVPVWIDSNSSVYEKLHATAPTIVLVRPDGYIGYRCQPADSDSLKHYLDGYLLREAA